MKHPMSITLAALTIFVATTGCWPNTDSEKDRQTEQRNHELQTQLRQQEERIDRWRTTAFGLGVSCVVVLIIGTAIGAKGKRDAQRQP